MDEASRHPADRLENRLEFETLISDTSATLLAAPPGEVEGAAERALARVREFFGADLCALLGVSRGGARSNVRLASYADGIASVPKDLNLTDMFPWSAHRLLVERAPVRISRRSELPPEAAVELPVWEQMGTRSALSLPIETAGDIRHIIVLQTMRGEREWPDAFLTRLRVLGGLLAAALDRAEMMAELREAEARISVAADSAGAGLWVMDGQTRTFWATERARTIFGYGPDEAITLERFRASVHPDDWPRVRDALEGGRTALHVEYRILLPDGRVRWISSRGRPRPGSNGEVVHITGASTDVTERRVSEEALRTSDARLASGADLAGLAFYEVDFENRVVYMDERFRALCGVPSEWDRGLRGLDFWIEHLHPDDRPRVMEMRARFHDGRADEASLEYRFLHPARGERWFHHLGRVARRDAAGVAVVTYGVLRDITDGKRADEELADLSRRLIDAHEDERAFLARELHDDVSQRLAVLAIDVGRAELEAKDGVLGERLRTVQDGLARLSEDVHSLAYQLHPSVLEELGLAEALRAACERLGRQGSVAVRTSLDHVPAGLEKDVALCLFRVAQEALNNVVRHAQARVVNVELRQRAGGLLLTIRDDGTGFDPSRPGPRRSLGLASMRERVRLLRGTLDVDSVPRHGTAIVAWVPLEGGSP